MIILFNSFAAYGAFQHCLTWFLNISISVAVAFFSSVKFKFWFFRLSLIWLIISFFWLISFASAKFLRIAWEEELLFFLFILFVGLLNGFFSIFFSTVFFIFCLGLIIGFNGNFSVFLSFFSNINFFGFGFGEFSIVVLICFFFSGLSNFSYFCRFVLFETCNSS